MRLNISLDDNLLTKIDAYCEKNNYGRSELIAELLRHRVMGVDISTISSEMVGSSTVEQSPVKAKVTGSNPVLPATGTMPVDKVMIISGRYDVIATTLPMWCQGHFEQGVTHTCYKISYEDENGTEVLKDKWFCEKCVRGYMNRVGKVYGHLE